MTGGRICMKAASASKKKGVLKKNKKFQNHLELSYYDSDRNGLAVLL